MDRIDVKIEIIVNRIYPEELVTSRETLKTELQELVTDAVSEYRNAWDEQRDKVTHLLLKIEGKDRYIRTLEGKPLTPPSPDPKIDSSL